MPEIPEMSLDGLSSKYVSEQRNIRHSTRNPVPVCSRKNDRSEAVPSRHLLPKSILILLLSCGFFNKDKSFSGIQSAALFRHFSLGLLFRSPSVLSPFFTVSWMTRLVVNRIFSETGIKRFPADPLFFRICSTSRSMLPGINPSGRTSTETKRRSSSKSKRSPLRERGLSDRRF